MLSLFGLFLLLAWPSAILAQGDVSCDELVDISPQCGGWEALGHCTENSFFYEQVWEACPSSCSGCGFNYQGDEDCAELQDNFEMCRMWVEDGHCAYRHHHYQYTMEQCPYSCAGCAPISHEPAHDCYALSDYHSKCAYWAWEGLCRDTSLEGGFMARNCAYSCNGCLSAACGAAKDKSSHCAVYRRSGWCEPDSEFYRDIIDDCAHTCNFCDREVWWSADPTQHTNVSASLLQRYIYDVQRRSNVAWWLLWQHCMPSGEHRKICEILKNIRKIRIRNIWHMRNYKISKI